MISFTVYGKPQPAGSKRILPAGGKVGGRPIVVDDAKGSRAWKQDVAAVALAAMNGAGPLDGPLFVTLRFVVERPRAHYGARGLLDSARAYPTVRPDVLKLARAVEDAMTGIVYRDDAQIVRELLVKVHGVPFCVDVEIEELPTTVRELVAGAQETER